MYIKTALTVFLILIPAGSPAFEMCGAERRDSTTLLNEVVVTGSNSAVPENLLPYTVSVIDNRQLEATGQTQVLSAISGMVPSLFVSQRQCFSVSESATAEPVT